MSQPLCGAKTRVGGTCRYPAMLGGARCRRHGGAIKRVRAAAQRRLAEEKAAKVVLGMALVPVTDPVACLRELTAETLAVKDVLLARVAQLQGDIRYQGATGEQVRAELTAYERAAERAGRLLTDLAKLGLDERQVRVSEAQVMIFAGVIARGLAADGLPEDMTVLARTSIAKELRLIEAGSA